MEKNKESVTCFGIPLWTKGYLEARFQALINLQDVCSYFNVPVLLFICRKGLSAKEKTNNIFYLKEIT